MRILLRIGVGCVFLLGGCASSAMQADVSDVPLADGGNEVVIPDAIADSEIDAPPSDAIVHDTPTPSDGGFACGPMTCDSATQYCQILVGGSLPDGGRNAAFRCDSFDIGCPTDHTCDCLRRNLKCINTCVEQNGGVTSTCG